MGTYKVMKKTINGEEEEIFSTHSEHKVNKAFIDEVSNTISNFDEYTEEDIEDIVAQGYERYGSGIVWIEDNGISPL